MANMFKKPTSVQVSQTPGGTQTFNLFSDNSQAPPPPQPRPSTKVAPQTYSAESPFNPNAPPSQEQRPSLLVRSDSATYKSHVDSPFSKEPARKTGRQSSAVNNQSSESPFVNNPNAPPPEQPVARTPSKANNQSQASPFVGNQNPNAPNDIQDPSKVPSIRIKFAPGGKQSFNLFGQEAAADPAAQVGQVQQQGDSGMPPPHPVQQQQQPPARRPSQANIQSEFSPFSDAPNNITEPSRVPSVRIKFAPGGAQNINLFGGPPPNDAVVKNTPTYSYAANSPFNKDAAPIDPNEAKRNGPPPKANVESAANPLHGGEYTAPAPIKRSPSKVNEPAMNSPFNPRPDPPRNNQGNFANRESSVSPFANPERAQYSNASGQARGPSVKIQQTPGGNTHFNIFEQQHAE